MKGFADGGANLFLIGSPEITEHELNNEFSVYYVCIEIRQVRLRPALFVP